MSGSARSSNLRKRRSVVGAVLRDQLLNRGELVGDALHAPLIPRSGVERHGEISFEPRVLALELREVWRAWCRWVRLEVGGVSLHHSIFETRFAQHIPRTRAPHHGSYGHRDKRPAFLELRRPPRALRHRLSYTLIARLGHCLLRQSKHKATLVTQ